MRLALFALFFSAMSFGKDFGIAPVWQLDLYDSRTQQKICAVNMIQPGLVLGGAHCSSLQETEIPVSSQDLALTDQFGTVYAVQPGGIHNYKYYSAVSLEGDITGLKVYPVNRKETPIKKFPIIPTNFKQAKAQKIFTTKWIPNDDKKIYNYRFPIKSLTELSSIYSVGVNYSLCQKRFDGSHAGSNSGSPLYTTNEKGQDILIGIHSKSVGCSKDDYYYFTNISYYSTWIQVLKEYYSE